MRRKLGRGRGEKHTLVVGVREGPVDHRLQMFWAALTAREHLAETLYLSVRCHNEGPRLYRGRRGGQRAAPGPVALGGAAHPATTTASASSA